MVSRLGAIERAIERVKASKEVSWAQLAEESDIGVPPWTLTPQVVPNDESSVPHALERDDEDGRSE